MNGWQRLFCVFSVACGLLFIVLHRGSYPTPTPPDGTVSVYACALMDTKVDRARAEKYLQDKSIPSEDRYSTDAPDADCTVALMDVALGNSRGKLVSVWFKELWADFGVLGISLGGLYALGMALGWIWRGFFPKKRPLA